MTTTLKTALGSLAVCLALGALASDPTIGGVMVQQRWPWSRLVDIDYVLTCDPGQSMDVAVEAYDGSSLLTLPASSFSGDLYGVQRGARRIVWDPTVTACTNSGVLPEFRVALTPTTSPLYMIVDLTKDAGADGQIEYIYPGDARLETYGRFTNVWFGVTNDSVYATDKLVLRRVHAGGFNMGDSVPPTISTTLTKDFYAGVFEVTEAQWQRIMTGTSGASRLAKNSVSYEDIRGATNNVPPINWYTTGSAVSPASFMGQIRARMGIGSFDLPTEAQWECFCRAGTTSYYNDGVSTSSSDTNILSRLGWWSGNSGATIHVVGGKESNAWGLYDTHGNVWEWCLDWDAGSLAGGADPSGAVSGSSRVFRSGGWGSNASSCRSASRLGYAPSDRSFSIGFRLVMTLP
jgi:formylglycine-generating enzyme required for sulfatase activity